MTKKIIDIKGMHCHSCEILVENHLQKINGIKKVNVNQNKGIAEIEYEGNLDDKAVEKAVCQAGYSLGKDETHFFSRNQKDYRDLGIAIFLAIALLLVARSVGLGNISFTNSSNFASLPVVFLIGLTAGLSTCMALVGGLVLGASAKYAEDHPNTTILQKFKPHLLFNFGRIASYFIFGGIIGFAGSVFQISTSVLGILIISVGLVMLLLGGQLVEIFPFLQKISFTIPKGITNSLGISQQSPLIAGAMTFFVPCGFTQAVQLYAISSGNPLTGALALGTFAIGTAPGLLSVGGFTALIKGSFAKIFFKTAGVIVIFLAVVNIRSGYTLTGWNPGGIISTIFFVNDVSAESENGRGSQVINMDQDRSGYSPNQFTLKRGIPVKWVINSLDSNNCASSVVVPALGIRRNLSRGVNIIEFTPTRTGQISFTCSMGMFGGVFNII